MSQTNLGHILRATALCLVMLCSLSAQAVDHALLVGVSDYPALPRRLWLRGPINDVALMREVLSARGIAEQRIRTLTSRAGGASEPTRANILRAMDEVQRQVNPGDRVVFYLSGHGSQQPQPRAHGKRPTEASGFDEAFLPADVRQWDGSRRDDVIPNALLDDEIGEWMDAVVDRGGSVYAVFDTCFAAGMARGGTGHWRAVSSADLGLSNKRAVAANPTASRRTPLRTDGRTLAFAARAHELTGEEWLPKGAPLGGNRVHGVFTFHLAQALRGHTALDSTSIAQAVAQAYREESRLSPTPLFLGELHRVWP